MGFTSFSHSNLCSLHVLSAFEAQRPLKRCMLGCCDRCCDCAFSVQINIITTGPDLKPVNESLLAYIVVGMRSCDLCLLLVF